MFQAILGQERALGALRRDWQSGRIPDCYLFVGPAGAGKRTVALEWAKAALCAGGQGNLLPGDGFGDRPCGDCSSCQKLDRGTHPDLFVLDFESQADLLNLKEEQELRQKEIKIEAVRVLAQRAYVSPVESERKVFIIDGAESLSPESANALLKVLEESPDRCRWVLIASGAERVLPTVRSRARRICFSPLEPDAVRRILERLRRPDAESARAIAEAAERAHGSLSHAAALLDEDCGERARWAAAAAGTGPCDPMRIAAQVAADKRIGARKSAEEFLKFLCLNLAGRLYREASGARARDLSKALESLQELRRNVSPQLVLESLLLSLERL